MQTNSCSSIKKLVTAFLFCILLSGCGKDQATIWFTESTSPDGNWIAEAQTDQYGGPGTAAIIFAVFLKSTTGKQGKIEILEISHSLPINLKSNWLSSSHLEITYNQAASSVDFQAIKAAGVNITVRNLSADGNSSH